MKSILTVFVVVLAFLVAFKLAGAIVHYFFWPLILFVAVIVLYLYIRGRRD